MSKKISIYEKRKWLDMYEQGKTEVQIARELGRDPRTIVKGIEEASKDRRLSSVEAEILRDALLKHQEQLMGVLKNIAAMLVMPPYNLEIREEADGTLAPIPLPGATAEHISGEKMALEIHGEAKLEWELLKEHLKREKLWNHLNQWRKALLDHVLARWQFRQVVRKLLEKEGLKLVRKRSGKASDYFLPVLLDLLYGVSMNRVLNHPDGTNLEDGLVVGEEGFVRHGPGGTELAKCQDDERCRCKIIAVLTALPQTSEANKVKHTEKELSRITETANREAEELKLLHMVTGKCRVCRRLGR